MAIFMTGATGFIGSYATDWLLRNTDHELALLVRAADYDGGVERLWRSLQLHMQADQFYRSLDRICFITGDLSEPDLGISNADYDWLISNAESVLHNAAALNFRSDRACTNHNLRGTLSVIKLARAIQDDHPLRRFTLVSTAAVAGERPGDTVLENEPLDWDRRDFNPYTRTKKFCEHMVRELLPDVPRLYLRPSSVIGDSRFSETTQFDMVRAFCVLTDLPVLPFSKDTRVDIVNADWVGPSIAELHLREDLSYDTYHLSAGSESRSMGEIAEAFSETLGKRMPRFVGGLKAPFEQVMRLLANLNRGGNAQRIGALLSVFVPYMAADIVYDNTRSVTDLHTAPVPFTRYGADLYHYAKSVDFEFPYCSLPEGLDLSNVPPNPVRPMA
ncbi:MAG: SDR family oxidoreductase [Myxococcales bacterium]|nr:SDR family oxidoreductase [Myxococcales bacterium]MDH3482816.1 SDR family oxidoreductase [Myxococcales bacterium]